MAVKNLAAKKITKLSNMDIDEISLVDDGAGLGTDVILMKQKGDALAEALELFGKRDVSDEPRDAKGRWVHEAVAALGEAKADATSHLRAVPVRAIQHLYSQAKLAAQGVASSVKSGTTKAFNAVRSTKLTAVHPVQGGGVEFHFEHEYKTGAKLTTKAQIRPEHVETTEDAVARSSIGRPLSHKAVALQLAHRYLVSSGRAEQPAFTEEGKSGWFRYNIQPQFTPGGGSSGGYSMFGGAQNPQPQQLSPAVSGNDPKTGIPIYVWQGRDRKGRDIRWERGTVHPKHGLIPEMYADVREHITHVQNWVGSNGPKGKEVRQALTLEHAGLSNGQAFFLPTGEYVPAANQKTQFDIARQYRDFREHGRTTSMSFASQPTQPREAPPFEMPSHMTGSAPEFAERVRPIAVSLSHNEAETLGDHLSEVPSYERTGVLSDLFHRSEDAAQNETPMHLSVEEANAAWHSLGHDRSRNAERARVRQKIGDALLTKNFAAERVRAKINT